MKWFTRKEKPMFKEIEAFAEKVAAKVKAAEDEVKQYFDTQKAKAVNQLRFDLEHFEKSLLEDGIKLDDEFAADLIRMRFEI